MHGKTFRKKLGVFLISFIIGISSLPTVADTTKTNDSTIETADQSRNSGEKIASFESSLESSRESSLRQPDSDGSQTSLEQSKNTENKDTNLSNSQSQESVKSQPFTIDEYQKSTALELAAAVRKGRTSSVDLVTFAYQLMEKEEPLIHAMISFRKVEALKEASELKDTGQPFLGVPLLVKGLGHAISGGQNTNGMVFLADKTFGYTSSFIKEFMNQGFIIIGQTNFPEMGLKNITDSKLYGPTGSPWNPLYQAGGSSGGSAAGVAAGYAPIATGSDAGGSIRIPASWNGIIGLKPSRGVGKGNSASETAQVNHFAQTKDMKDTIALFEALKTIELPKVELTPKAIKIAYTTESPVGSPVSPDAVKAVDQAVAFLKSQGYLLEKVGYPYDGIQLMKDYYTLAAGSMGMYQSQVAKKVMTIENVDWTTWALTIASKNITKEDTENARQSIRKATDRMEEFHKEYPLLLTPTTASTAPLVGDSLMKAEHIEKIKRIDTLSKEDQRALIYDQWLPALTYTPYTQMANLTGEPAISLPTYVSPNGLPLGIQFNAGQKQDWLLLQIGSLFENYHQFKKLADKGGPKPPTTTESSSKNTSTSTSENRLTGENSVSEQATSSTQELSSKEQLTLQPSSQKDTKSSQSDLPNTGVHTAIFVIVFGSILIVAVLFYGYQAKKGK